ncbi:TRZ/ATZ family hydrolase [Kangiella sediminilitoris]|uniref:N-ethylammeline chlorohydrolase n=1 Tax=Kangiella sediminilitoris TaxID=1144748 RepID=A0A1B3BBN2_9GAMM|nr:TRZ/ATZ family hydrolase [Kangiella sediminilitoris]AOE50199.1 N-ethylammeline chlorohydrolase [Kangiella sediminilitoris]
MSQNEEKNTLSQVDEIITPEWIIPVSRNGKRNLQALTKHSIAINKHKIVAISPTSQLLEQYSTTQHVQLPGQALIPGFVNSHTHAAMSLFKGLSDDLPLMMWLENHIWPAEKKWVDNSFCSDGVTLAVAEMLLSGTTCFNDMYFQPNMTAKVAQKLGMRATIGMLVFDFPSVWGTGWEDYLKKGLNLRDDYKHSELLSFAFAPHAPYTVSDEALGKIATLSNELSIPVHMHIHETAHEIKESLSKYGKRPLKRLQELELVNPNLIAVHMTQLQRNEIETVANHGVSVVHCPQSNMKLASGISPVQELLTANINVALGTDGNASNNDLNMFSEMKTASLLSKVYTGSAQASSAEDMLYAATMGGAKALGIDETCGSIEIGKAADLTSINLNTIQAQPLYDPVSQIVYTAGREQVTHVWVNGRLQVEDGKLTQLDEQKLISMATSWRDKIQNSRANA